MKKLYRQVSPALISVCLFIALTAAAAIFVFSSGADDPPMLPPVSGGELTTIAPGDPPLTAPLSGNPLVATLVSLAVALTLIPLSTLLDRKTGQAKRIR